MIEHHEPGSGEWGARKVIWQIRAIAGSPNNESAGMETFNEPKLLNGFNLDTIDGGSLRVYLR
jgi:hypothetical protein